MAAGSRCKRPTLTDIEALQAELEALERETATDEAREKIVALKEQLAKANAKRKWVGFIDPIDVRFNSFTEQPVPTSQAVMFCLMDVSGSMGEREKDLAKRFYMLLHLFLKRRYKKVDVVFIRHTHDAQEVDEQEFFYSRQSGGTIVSTALDKMLEIQKERYATADWNIYAAQASDGYTQSGDARHCVEMLNGEIMPLCQYYAYIEILDEREMEVFASEESGAELWRAYRTVAELWPNFATKRISKPADIFPVFRELFKKGRRPRHVSDCITGASLFIRSRNGTFATLDRTYQGDRGHRAQRTEARRLSQPDRDDLVRADARCLFLARHAADVQSLELRQAVRARGNDVPRAAIPRSPTRSSSIPARAFPICSKKTP